MNEEIQRLEAEVRKAAVDGPERAEALNELAKALWRDALEDADEQTLRKAISTIKKAIGMSKGNPTKLSGYLNNLGLFLTDRTTMSGNTSFLNEAIETLEEGAAWAPVALKSVLLLNLGNALRTLVELLPNRAVIDRAITTYQEGLQSTPSESCRPKLLNGLATALLHRFCNSSERSLDDLQEASVRAAEAINSSDDDHPYRVVFLDTYASVLQSIFAHQPSIEVLDEAIEYGSMAVELAAEQSHPKTLQLMINLADALRLRHRVNNTGPDLDDALSILEEALTESPGPPLILNHGKWCYSLCLLYRFERDGDGEDLHNSIRSLISVCDATDEGSERWIQYRATLGQALICRFDFMSSPDDIDQAVDILKDVASRDSDNSSRLSVLHGDLSVALLSRFELRGSLIDLNDASAAAQKALDLAEESPVDYSIAQVAYANVLLRTYQQTDEEKYLENAIELYQAATHDGVVWASLLPGRLYTLSYALQLRCALGRDNSEDDWNSCLAAAKRGVELSKQHHDRYIHIGQLGSAYLEKAKVDEESPACTELLEEAVKHLTTALSLMPQTHSYRSLWLNNLGLAYEVLDRHQPGSGFHDLALLRYQEAAELETASPVLRVTAAYRAIVLLSRLSDLQRATHFVRLAIDLLPTISPRLLKREDQQDLVSLFSGLGSYGAAVLLHAGNRPAEAVRALEATRGVMNSMLIDTRTDITLLEERDKVLAQEFRNICGKLDHATSAAPSQLVNPSSINRDPETRIAAAKAFDDIVRKIRKLDGLQDFLMAPTDEQIETLATSTYLILVNVSSLRSDALIIDSNNIWNINLTDLTLGDTVNNANRLSKTIEEEASGNIDRLEANHIIRGILAWLWHTLVQPVLSNLPQSSSGIQHRICWIPASAMTNLPIHAATDTETGSNAMDSIISSYATTLKSLHYSQHKAARLRPGSGTALLVAMKQTPAMSDLSFAVDETTSLRSLLSPSVPVTLLSNPQLSSSHPITKTTVLSHLHSVEVLHLSCHGLSDDTNPSQSRLFLPDWQTDALTVSDIAGQQLPNARLAYLSACHAAVGRAPELLDEGIHIAAAFQLAGFPQVVGTLWQVNDRRAMQVSGRMWRDILGTGAARRKIRYQEVAGALNAAIRELRESTKRADDDGDDDDDMDIEFEDEPFLWAPFVYMGM